MARNPGPGLMSKAPEARISAAQRRINNQHPNAEARYDRRDEQLHGAERQAMTGANQAAPPTSGGVQVQSPPPPMNAQGGQIPQQRMERAQQMGFENPQQQRQFNQAQQRPPMQPPQQQYNPYNPAQPPQGFSQTPMGQGLGQAFNQWQQGGGYGGGYAGPSQYQPQGPGMGGGGPSWQTQEMNYGQGYGRPFNGYYKR